MRFVVTADSEGTDDDLAQLVYIARVDDALGRIQRHGPPGCAVRLCFRRHDADPQLYLTQLLVNLPSTPISQLATWLPDQWKKRQKATAALQ